ncbi:MAG: type II toxin-antitoxin system PemK/MazF family toxin [Elusimicrobia bacterium]|nr:type II toxin-antitoxin system PemK/MazF family toxin [Elusimicrobiota bacterium]
MIPHHPIRRGDVYDLDFGGVSAGMEDLHPALVIQNDIANAYAPYTIMVAIHHDTGKQLPVLVSVPQGVAGLTKNSVVDCGHVATVGRDQLGALRGRLPHRYLALVDQALKTSLDLR